MEALSQCFSNCSLRMMKSSKKMKPVEECIAGEWGKCCPGSMCVYWRLNVILAVLWPLSLPLHILLPHLECSSSCSVWGPPAVLQVSHSILTCLILTPSSVSWVVVTCLQLSPSAVGKGGDQVLLLFIFQMSVTELVSGGLWNDQSFIDPCLQFTFIEHPFIS